MITRVIGKHPWTWRLVSQRTTCAHATQNAVVLFQLSDRTSSYAISACSFAVDSASLPIPKLPTMGRTIDQEVHAAFVEFRAKGITA